MRKTADISFITYIGVVKDQFQFFKEIEKKWKCLVLLVHMPKMCNQEYIDF